MRKLSSQILASQLAILVATVLLGFVLFAHEERVQLDQQYELRALSIAETVAGVPDIERCLERSEPGCGRTVQHIATRIQRETGAAYIVVIDMNRVRHSHPHRNLIGRKVSEPIVTADGQTHVGIDNGSTGPSANGKAPLYGPGGRMVGEVSAGLRESNVSSALWHELPTYAGWFAVALAGGVVVSWLLAGRLKRRTFGLELDEIARLLQEREATLHGIREGVIAFDEAGRITMVNDEARRLLMLGMAPVGGRLDELLPAGRLRDVLSGKIGGQDEVVLTDEFCLTVNHMPIRLAGAPHGSVVTLRDRTEMSGLLRELDGVHSLTDSLRAQQHEFSNRMHTLAGLLELGRTEEALGYLTDLRGAASDLAESLPARIGSPIIVGLLLGKAADASERGVAFDLSPETWLGDSPQKVQAVTTILGNLIDNAFDAVAGMAEPHVRVSVIEDDDAITIQVADNGPGIPPGSPEEIFADGFTTKSPKGSLRRGLGLALVHRIVQRLHGSITASSGPGAVLTVRLPRVPRPAAIADAVAAR